MSAQIPEGLELPPPADQLDWFDHQRGMERPLAVWNRYYCVSVSHRGLHCDSCLDDKADGHGDDIEGCCCRALWDDDELGETP